MAKKLMPTLGESSILLSKFRGSMLGGLLGDCYGAPFEGDDLLEAGDKLTLRRYFDKLEGPYFKAPVKSYTDDTSMTKIVAKCLITHKGIDSKQLAGDFMREYFNEPKRGYGGSVVSIFAKLRQTKLADPLAPAREQFNGNGSFGNGAAMRVAPVGLFCHNKQEKLVELVKKSAEITHTHRLGINGAILEALAVQYCVNVNSEDFDAKHFLEDIAEKMKKIEIDDEGIGLPTGIEYQQQIGQIQRLLSKGDPSTEEILNKLGNDVSAIYSVPTAIYCFLKAQKDIEGIHTDNTFRRTLEYAISLGGDTDTIASMAGSICGALLGDSIIADNLIKHCEAHGEIISLATNLHNASI